MTLDLMQGFLVSSTDIPVRVEAMK